MWTPTIAVLLLFYGVYLHYLVLGLPGFAYPDGLRLVGWRDLGRQVEQIEDQLEALTGDDPLGVGLDKYNIASELAFYRQQSMSQPQDLESNESVLATSGRHLFGRNSLMYAYWFNRHQYEGQDMIFVGENIRKVRSIRVTARFHKLDPVKTIMVRHRGKPVRQYYYRVVYRYWTNNPLLQRKSSSGQVIEWPS